MVLITLPRDAWYYEVVFHTVSLENQVTSYDIETLFLHAGLCRGGPNTSIATRGIIMESEKPKKSFCKKELRKISDWARKWCL